MVTDDTTPEPEILPPEKPLDFDSLLFILTVEALGIAIIAERLIQGETP
jgi:hypothetical protein